MDGYYLQNHYNLHPDSFYLEHWHAIGQTTNQLNELDLSKNEDFSLFTKSLDTTSFIDYFIAETYFRNKD